VFGYATFAQAPFAALGGGGAVIDVALSETGSSASATSIFASVLTATNAEGMSTAAAVNTINNIFNPLIAEAASGSSAQTAQATLAGLIAEVASTQAAQTVIATMLGSVAEGATALATPTASAVFLASILEAASGASANTASKLVIASISEAASGAAAVTNTAVFVGTVAEVASALDVLTVLRTANVFPTGIQIYVYIGDALVWAVIDDSQTPGWTVLPS
jgi:hypothetical protein